jgi:hypothetical protein
MKTRHQKPLLGLACALLASSAQILVGATYQSTVLSQGPVGYWRLNETVQPQPGVVAANSGSLGSSENGAYIAFPTRGLPGPFAGSVGLGLDGSASYVSNVYQAAINSHSFTFEIWANPAQVPKFAYLASSVEVNSPRSGWYMAQDDGSTFGHGNGFAVRMFKQDAANPSADLFATNDLPLGSWYHIVLTYDGTTAKLYKNGVLASSMATNAYVGNVDAPFTIGCRSSLNFFWPGSVAEVAEYNTALSAARVAAHYTAGTTTPATYPATVQADAPLVYQRYQEPIDPPAANLGTAGAAANGLFIYDAQAGVAGPSSPPYVGFEAANKAAAFDGGGGVVRIPALNLNTNTVTISGWVKASTDSETPGAGLILCESGTTYAGLTIDGVNGGLGLGYIWNNDVNTYNVSLSQDLGLPTLPSSADNQWAYVALVVQPNQAAVFICQSNNAASFAGVTNAIPHANQAFAGPTLVGTDVILNSSFAGGIDEVAIFNRTLGVGELYTQYGAAVGGVSPKIFSDLQGPAGSVAAGDPIVLTIDAGGTPALTYTWHRNGGTVATTSSGTYTIPTSALTDGGNYDVTISGVGSPAQSQTIAVSVVTPTAPAITGTTGFKNRTIYPGGSVIASITATGGGLKYQWYKNTALIAGATSAALSIPGVTTANAGNYSVSATNSIGSVTNGPFSITITNPVAGSYEALVVTAAPEAWWRLDESPGTTNMFDGMGRHDGLYTNLNSTIPPVALGAGGSLSSDSDTAATFANGGLGVVPFSPELNTPQFSVEAWVKTTVTGGSLVPLSSSFGSTGFWEETIGGWWSGNSSAGSFGNNGNANTAAQIAPDQWTHLVITYDSTRVISGTTYPFILYANGQTDGFVWGAPPENNSGPFIIGGRGVSASVLADRLFNGQVDEVAVYKRLLSATEVQSHFNGRFGSTTAPYFIGSFLPQTVTPGKSISYSTIVNGSVPIKLQWYKGSSPISGQTNVTFAITNTAVSDTATYTLWATNSAGVNSQSVNVTVIPATGFANVTNGLVLHMRMDGDTTDTSGRNNNGTPVNSPGFVTGLIGSQALSYATSTNGSGNVDNSSYVTLGRPLDLQFDASTSFTISLWINQTNGAENGDLPFIGTEVNSANNPGWDLCPSYHAGGWQWNLNDNVNNFDMNGPNDSINDAHWHNFVLSVDRSGHFANTYLDGVLVGKTDITVLGNIDNGGPVVIGQDPTGLYPEAGGFMLDDVGIWRRPLSALEVAQIESAGRTSGHSFDTVSPAVTLSITRSGSSLTISWASGTLYQSDSLGSTAVWTPVGGASAPSYTFTPSGTGKYYRVQ